MAQYIDKDALVAEIERLKADALQKKSQCKRSGLERIMHQISAYNKIISFLDTLEVKEVDLEKESELIANGIMISVQSNKYGTNTYNTERNDFNHYHLKMAARKGIELGLKAQNYNNKCEDLRDDGICNFATTKLGRTMRCENISCSRRNKAQKGEMI